VRGAPKRDANSELGSSQRLRAGSAVAGLVLFAMALGCDRHVKKTLPAPFAPPLAVTVSASGAKRSVLDVVIDCKAPAKPIDPGIYGTGYDPSDYSDVVNPGIYGIGEGHSNMSDERQWQLGATGRRFGGNSSSRYNWELGTFNHGSDWVFANDGTPAGEPLFERFLRENEAKGVGSAITIPILGWVAKDRTSAAFPVASYPDQSGIDGIRGAGEGRTTSGRIIPSPSPTVTSVAAPPETEGRWVKAMASRAPSGTSPRVYILDNEPGLWNSTHRDIHPDPVSYDELMTRTIAYAKTIRQNDPHGLIAGPSAYGWPDYLYSGKDATPSYKIHLDRRLHGDLPLLAYYLHELHRHEQETGERLLDLLDVHFYPQGDDVGVGTKGGEGDKTAAMRIRSTRALWDPTYVDESWIGEPIRLLPRLREWIDQYYPGIGIEIGEWNFGAEGHMSGALAVAEVLGRFAQAGVARAFYWTFPSPGSATFFAFRAFRNFDGRGGRFEDALVPLALSPEGTSIWASRDPSGKHVVVVVLDLMPDVGLDARIHLASCGAGAQGKAYVYVQGATDFAMSPLDQLDAGIVGASVPPYSLTTLDIRLE
jgi:Glycoside hydrolase family 44